MKTMLTVRLDKSKLDKFKTYCQSLEKSMSEVVLDFIDNVLGDKLITQPDNIDSYIDETLDSKLDLLLDKKLDICIDERLDKLIDSKLDKALNQIAVLQERLDQAPSPETHTQQGLEDIIPELGLTDSQGINTPEIENKAITGDFERAKIETLSENVDYENIKDDCAIEAVAVEDQSSIVEVVTSTAPMEVLEGNDDNDSNLTENIKLWKNQGLTYTELAKRLKKGDSTLRNWNRDDKFEAMSKKNDPDSLTWTVKGEGRGSMCIVID